MKVGDTLLLSDNTCAIIEQIQVEQLSKPETTYNFEVEDFHTYYVTGSKVLVHNLCWEEVSQMSDEELAQFWDKGTQSSSLENMNKHYNKHVIEKSLNISKAEYTYDALSLWDDTESALKIIKKAPQKKWQSAIPIQTSNEVGLYTRSGKIIFYYYKPWG